MPFTPEQEAQLKEAEEGGWDTSAFRAWDAGGRLEAPPPARRLSDTQANPAAHRTFKPEPADSIMAAIEEGKRGLKTNPAYSQTLAHNSLDRLPGMEQIMAAASGFNRVITGALSDRLQDSLPGGRPGQQAELRAANPRAATIGAAGPMLLAPEAAAAMEGANLSGVTGAAAQFLGHGGVGGLAAGGAGRLAQLGAAGRSVGTLERMARGAGGNILGAGLNAGAEALGGGAPLSQAASDASEAMSSPENLALSVGTAALPAAADATADWIREGPEGSMREQAAQDIRTTETSGQVLPKRASLLPAKVAARAGRYNEQLVRGLEDKGRRVGRANASEESLVQRRLAAKHGGDPLIDVQAVLDEADKFLGSKDVGTGKIKSKVRQKMDEIRQLASSLPTFEDHVPPESTTPGGARSGGIDAVERGPMELQLLGRSTGEPTEPGKATVRDLGTAPTMLSSPGGGVDPTIRPRRPRPSEPIPGGRAPEGLEAQDVTVQEPPGEQRSIDYHEGRGVGARPTETLRVDAPYKLPASHLENLIEELSMLGNEAAGVAKGSDKPFRRLASVARSLRLPQYQAQQRRAHVRQNRLEQLYSDLGEGHVKTLGREAADEAGGGPLRRLGGASETAGAEQDRMERFRTQFHDEDRRLQEVPSGGPEVPAATMMRALEALRAKQRLTFNPFVHGATHASRLAEPVLGGAIYPAFRGLGNIDPAQAAMVLRPFLEAAAKERDRDDR